MAVKLEQPILDGGVKFVNFFEGRILTSRDLTDEQVAERRQRLRLGEAVGAGIVAGLMVTLDQAAGSSTAPVVTVAPGLAINAEGEALAVTSPTKLELVRTLVESAAARPDLFGPCEAAGPGASLPAAVGLYVLVIGPATEFEQEAPKAGLGSGVADGCGRRYATRGVRFRLRRVDVAAAAATGSTVAGEIETLLGSTSTTALSRLRNLVAHAFLGTEDKSAFAVDPFPAPASGAAPVSAWAEYGLASRLAEAGAPVADACEVPLALVYWTASGLRFLDARAVRRRAARPSAEPDWPLLWSDRREAEAEAAFAHFQEHLEWLREALGPGGARALRDFRFLPAAGLVRSAEREAFFDGLPVDGPYALPRARFLDVLERGRAHPPLDLEEEPGLRLFQVGGAEAWLLFTDARTPSPEATAAATAAAADDLEEALDALRRRIAGLERSRGDEGRGRITGSVVLPEGLVGRREVPVAGGEVTIRPVGGGDPFEIFADDSGVFDVELDPGRYEIVGRNGEPVVIDVEAGGVVSRNVTPGFGPSR